MSASKRIIIELLVIVAAVSVSAGTASLITQQSFHSTGYINGVGCALFSNYACTMPLGTITWTNLTAGQSATQVIYVQNNGTLPITLALAGAAFTPEQAAPYLALSWNRESYVLQPAQSCSVVLTLTVSPTCAYVGSFSVSSTISGVTA